ncbi:uncharacterized protein LOC131858371 [Cryptomeria japonica]|uniref:uncharacterized protein LOC131858371 n=1 Tax=Cryptomeria japonica TaxID=3369 RepID=UPI0027DA16CD|nr:uncharacterized protein LOC131858371 [Cryptomeria japonica]
MVLGLVNVGATFQIAMDIDFRGIIGTYLIVYLDDLTVFSKDRNNYLFLLEDVLRRCHEHGISLNPKKSIFGVIEDSSFKMSGGGRQGLYPLWKYVDRVPGPKGLGGTATIKCKLCNLGWKGAITTTYSHDIESEVDVTSRGLATGPAPKRPHIDSANPIGRLFDVQGRQAVGAAIGRFFYANGISFNMARSPFYEEMVRAINNAPASYKPPGYEKLRTTLVDKEKSLLEEQTAPLKRVWAQEGCSIVMDGWTNARNRPLLNIMVTCSKGPYFLKAIDCSGQKKNARFLHSQLCDSIEEVGASHVVQVVTDAAPVCKAAGMFICNHHHTQAIYRKYAKVELLKPADTRFASYFILLDRLCEVKGALCSTFVSDAWAAWKQSTSDIAVDVRAMVLDEHFRADVKFVVDFIKPICEVIKFADSDKVCLGEVYEAIDSMCERVKKIIDAKDISLYPLIEEKLHGRWNKLNTPLHCAAYALNPKWYDIEVTKKRAPH